MTNPFQIGDDVYHTHYQKLKVIRVDKTGEGPVVLTDSGWFKYKELSFEPWPKPVHKRPMKNGYYLIYHGDLLTLAVCKKDKWFVVRSDKHFVEVRSVVTPLQYLGEDFEIKANV